MRNVKRGKIPSVLSRKGKTWKEELLAELAKGSGGDKKRIKALKKKYAHKDVRAGLKKMYKFCCYCESQISHVTVDHIEHRKPQAKFPEDTFEWDNLHLACPDCNGAKVDQWDQNNPILDAVNDVPITDHLVYRNFFRHPLTMRGKTTRDHADLNRKELIDAREPIFWDTMDIIEEFNNNPDAPGSDDAYRKLSRLGKGQFGSLVEYLVKTWMVKQCA
jgi:uncharacterized protein (TIGR02646 family)